MPVMTPPEEAYKPRRRHPFLRFLATLFVLAALAVGGLFAWTKVLGNEMPEFLTHLPFDITLPGMTPQIELVVNGEEVKVDEGTTLQELFDKVKPNVKAGNLLSVSGKTIGEGQGTPYTASVDEDPVPVDNAAKTVLKGGEKVSFSDGIDVEEDFTVETTQTGTPRLVKKVQEGASPGGESIQQGTVQYVYQWGHPAQTQTKVGTVSGEKVAGEGTMELQDCIIMAQDIHPDNDEKLVALTFDDGPVGDYTSQYLEILARYDVKATFNLIGKQIDEVPGVAQEIANQGHQVCSHSWDHAELPTLSSEEMRTQIADSFAKIKEATGVDSSTMRAPYGNMDINVWLASGGSLSASVYWTHDSEDWKLPGVDTIVSNCTTGMRPGSVILMHDGGGDREQDLEALPRIIEAWQAEGYRFVTVAELLASDSSIPAGAGDNYVPMPEDAVWPTEIGEATQDVAAAGEAAAAEAAADEEIPEY